MPVIVNGSVLYLMQNALAIILKWAWKEISPEVYVKIIEYEYSALMKARRESASITQSCHSPIKLLGGLYYFWRRERLWDGFFSLIFFSSVLYSVIISLKGDPSQYIFFFRKWHHFLTPRTKRHFFFSPKIIQKRYSRRRISLGPVHMEVGHSGEVR